MGFTLNTAAASATAEPNAAAAPAVDTCIHCDKAAHAKGLCTRHYNSLRNHGDALAVDKKQGRTPQQTPSDIVYTCQSVCSAAAEAAAAEAAAAEAAAAEAIANYRIAEAAAMETYLASLSAAAGAEAAAAEAAAVAEDNVANAKQTVNDCNSAATASAEAAAVAEAALAAENAALAAAEAAAKQTQQTQTQTPAKQTQTPTLIKSEYYHYAFGEMLRIAKRRHPMMLIGPAGSGKTHTAEQLSNALGFACFGATSCCEDTPLTAFFGRTGLKDGNTYLIETDFTKCFTQGGLYLLDEADRLDANIMVSLNRAIANRAISVDGIGTVHAHKDFYVVCGMNTAGLGADRQYNSANQLCASTHSRFAAGKVSFGYDKKLERKLWAQKCNGFQTELAELFELRKRIDAAKVERVGVDTRFLLYAAEMLADGETIEYVKSKLFFLWTADELRKVDAAA